MFLLSSFLDTQKMSLQFVRDRAVRYLVPHAAFVVLGAIAFGAMQSGTEPATVICRIWPHCSWAAIRRSTRRRECGGNFRSPTIVGADAPIGVAILAATIIGSIAFAVIVWRIPLLRRMLFPRSWHDWVTAS